MLLLLLLPLGPYLSAWLGLLQIVDSNIRCFEKERVVEMKVGVTVGKRAGSRARRPWSADEA